MHPLKQNSLIIRAGDNCHRYVCFLNGKIVSFTTHEKDFLSNLAQLFGALNNLTGAIRFAVTQLGLILTLLALISGLPVYALPQGYEVVSGDVTFQVNNKELVVTSTGNQAIVEYQSFNVSPDERVQFNLAGANASILNRILGGPSAINGAIQSNGQVFLVNPAGIRIGKTAHIQTGGFIASTLNLSNNNYLNNTLKFQRAYDTSSSGIHNEGHLEAKDFIALLGNQLSNGGVINVEEGSVAMAVGDQIQVDISPNMAVEITVDEGLKEQIETVEDHITNTGKITAHTIALEAKLAKSAISRVVNLEGIIQATAMKRQGGKISLKADTVKQAGRIIAEGTNEADGGKIELRSTRLTVLEESSVTSVRGQGKSSSAGEIVVWSDGNTDFQAGAVLDARGGDVSGDGGFIEVSAVDTVLFAGTALGQANDGTDGTILIDPTDIRIQAGGPAGSASTLYTAANNSGGESIFQASTFNGFGNVVLEATNDIFVETPWNLGGINAGGSLTLRAGNNIQVQQAVTTNGGDINLVADAPLGGASNDVGGIHITGTGSLDSAGGNISLSGATVNIDNTVTAGTTGTVSLIPSTGTPGIELAGAVDNNDTAGVRFDVSSAELGRISASTLSVGDSSLTNNITLAGNIDVSQVAGSPGSYGLSFNTGGDFIGTGRTINLGSTTNSLNFDGANDYLAIQNLFYNTANNIDELTVITWLRMPTYQRSSLVDFDRSEHYSFGVNFANAGGNDGKISFDTYSTAGGLRDFASNSRIDDGQWHMAAARFDANLLNDKAIFIDGVLDREINQYANGINLGKNATRFGIVGDGSEATAFNGGRNFTYFRGDMQGVQIYDQALTNAEIAAIYANGPGLTGAEPGLVLGYDFTTNTPGNTVTDLSGNGYDGNLFNNPTWQGGNPLTINAGGNVNTGAITSAGQTANITAGGNITVDGNITAPVTLTADSTMTNVGSLIVNNTLNTSGSSVTFTAAQVDINNTVDAGSGVITFQPSTDKAIALADANDNNDSAVLFDLSLPEFGRIIANELSVGSLNLSNDISLAGNLDLTGAAGTDPGAFDLTLNTGGSFLGNNNFVHLGRGVITLDGVDDYFAIQNLFYNAQNIDELTVAGWLKTTDDQGTILDFDRSEHYSYGVNFAATTGNGTVSWDTTAGAAVDDQGSTVRVDDGQWHFVVTTFDRSVINDKAIYIDGVLDNAKDAYATNTSLGKVSTRYGIVGDGSEATAFNGARNSIYYGGQLDEIRVYDRALSAGEITALYNNGLGITGTAPEANLVLGYNFNETSGITANDFSGNGYHATLFNGGSWSGGSQSLTVNTGGSVTGLSMADDAGNVAITANNNGVGGVIDLTYTNSAATPVQLSPGGNSVIGTATFDVLPDPVVNTGNNTPWIQDNNSNIYNQSFYTSQGNVIQADGITTSPIQLPPSPLSPEARAYGNGSIQAVEADGSVVYTTNPNRNTISVIQSETGTIIQNVPVGNNPSSIALNPTQPTAYVTNTDSNTVSLISTDTHQVVATIPVGEKPKGLVVHPDGNSVYVTNFNSNTVSVIDTGTNTVVTHIPTGQKPIDVAVHPSGNFVYVANYQSHTLSVIDASMHQVTYDIAVGKGPRSVKFSPSGDEAYTANYLGNTVSVVDTVEKAEKNAIEVKRNPYGIAVSEDGKQIFAASRVGPVVSVIDRETGEVVETLPASDLPIFQKLQVMEENL
ncbi:MAG: filamentous hemagglutinin N-terminal domain-containing protein [Vampirovibrio sp.]|nr:filamentous hemagglutinin N-terminal domain-containing protein [Vampirovibrio sp.]